LREELGLSKETPVVGIVAALRPEKRHDRFLHCAARVLGHVPAARFLIVGEGTERRRLEVLAADLGLVQSVRFLGNREDVPELLALFDVMLLTSDMEANPVSILEAMATEKPVVAPAVGSVGETVVDGKTGRLFAPGDVEGAAAAVVELLTQPERAGAMGRAGREAVLADWSIEQMIKGWETLLSNTYQSKAAGQRQACAAPTAGKKSVGSPR
jgi:glycosyltransferase involved in cell wall biosynthesis